MGELGFRNIAELWFTESVIYIATAAIWYLLIKHLWLFCLRKDAPRLLQYEDQSLKKVMRAAEASRTQTRLSQIEPQSQLSQTAGIPSMRNSVDSTDSHPQHTRERSVSLSGVRHSARHSVTIIRQSITAMDLGNHTEAEFQLSICRIHRNLRICCILSLLFATIYITSVSSEISIHSLYSQIDERTISVFPEYSEIFCQRIETVCFFSAKWIVFGHVFPEYFRFVFFKMSLNPLSIGYGTIIHHDIAKSQCSVDCVR